MLRYVFFLSASLAANSIVRSRRPTDSSILFFKNTTDSWGTAAYYSLYNTKGSQGLPRLYQLIRITVDFPIFKMNSILSSAMDAKPFKIFISYRRKDSEDAAGRLEDALKTKYPQCQVFKDVTMIKGGTHFPSVIKGEIQTSDLLILLIGKRWTGERRFAKARIFEGEDLVRIEVETAIKEGKRIIPVLVNTDFMPNKEDLPVSIQLIQELNAIKLRTGEWHKDFPFLSQQLELLLNTELPKYEQALIVPPKARRLLPRPVIVIAVTAILIISIALLRYFGTSSLETMETSIPRPWKEKVVGIRSISRSPVVSSGFFVSGQGHILALRPDQGSTEFEIITSDSVVHQAKLIGRYDVGQMALNVLKIENLTTPYFDIQYLVPQTNLSVQIFGVDASNSKWTGYAVRVFSVNGDTILYQRPENVWMGMLGSPIVTLADEIVIGVHMGKVMSDSSNSLQLANGYLFRKAQVDSILKLYQGKL